MAVRAKMRCTEKADLASSWGVEGQRTASKVVLSPVAGPGNEPWSKYTPSGRVELLIDNPEAFAAFEVGKDYFVDFTPVEG